MEFQIIEEHKKLKQLDVELANKETQIREQNNTFQKLAGFNEGMLKQLEAFEEENRQVEKLVGNIDEIKTAIANFEEIIFECKEFLASV